MLDVESCQHILNCGHNYWNSNWKYSEMIHFQMVNFLLNWQEKGSANAPFKWYNETNALQTPPTLRGLRSVQCPSQDFQRSPPLHNCPSCLELPKILSQNFLSYTWLNVKRSFREVRFHTKISRNIWQKWKIYLTKKNCSCSNVTFRQN